MRRHRTSLFSFLLRFTGDRARAEDLCQEVFLRVVSASTGWKERARFTTWLYAIARNLAVDEARRMSFRRVDPLETGEPDPKGHLEPASEDPLPDRAVEAARIRPKAGSCAVRSPRRPAGGVLAPRVRWPSLRRDRRGHSHTREHGQEPDAIRARGPARRTVSPGRWAAGCRARLEERYPLSHGDSARNIPGTAARPFLSRAGTARGEDAASPPWDLCRVSSRTRSAGEDSRSNVQARPRARSRTRRGHSPRGRLARLREAEGLGLSCPRGSGGPRWGWLRRWRWGWCHTSWSLEVPILIAPGRGTSWYSAPSPLSRPSRPR